MSADHSFDLTFVLCRISTVKRARIRDIFVKIPRASAWSFNFAIRAFESNSIASNIVNWWKIYLFSAYVETFDWSICHYALQRSIVHFHLSLLWQNDSKWYLTAKSSYLFISKVGSFFHSWNIFETFACKTSETKSIPLFDSINSCVDIQEIFQLSCIRWNRKTQFDFYKFVISTGRKSFLYLVFYFIIYWKSQFKSQLKISILNYIFYLGYKNCMYFVH